MKTKPSLAVLCLFTISFATACSSLNKSQESTSAKPANQPSANIVVTNPSNTQYSSTTIAVPFAALPVSSEFGDAISLLSGKQTIPTETIDRDGDGKKDIILALADIGPKQSMTWKLNAGGVDAHSTVKQTKRTQAEISVKEGGSWIPHPNAEGKKAYQGGTFVNVDSVTLPEYYTDHSKWIRYEGPGIESDQVAYRIYLDHRNGFDIFGKKVNELVLQNIGQDGYDSYHNMLSWGMDILKVGSSLGAGGFGYWDGKKLVSVSDTQGRSARIIENGNLYSSFAIDYDQWLVEGERQDLSALFSMQAGSRLVNTRIMLEKSLPNLAIGVVKHTGTEFLQSGMASESTYSYIGSWGKQSESGDHLGMAVIFKTQQFLKTVEDPTSYVALVQPEKDDSHSMLEYYFVTAWQGEHGKGISSKQEFVAYLQDEIKKLSQPLVIDVTLNAAPSTTN